MPKFFLFPFSVLLILTSCTASSPLYAQSRSVAVTSSSKPTQTPTAAPSAAPSTAPSPAPSTAPSPAPSVAPSTAASSIKNGVNMLPDYYNNGYPDLGWSLMANYSAIKSIRFLVSPDQVSQAVSWLAQARSNGHSVILAYNIYAAQGSDDQSLLTTAAHWWVSNYVTLTKNKTNPFTLNLMNEWGSHFISPSDFAAGYNAAISIVRQVYSGPIILEAPGYGQEVHTVFEAVTGTGTTITDKNIIISVHLFPYSWYGYTGTWMTASDLHELSNISVPVIVGEFGFVESQTSGADINSLVSYAESQRWPMLGWSWNGDGMGANMIQPSWSDYAYATSYTVTRNFQSIYSHL